MNLKCLIVDDDEMARATIKHYVEQTDFLEIGAICEDALEASKILKEKKIDIIFLDVEMPNMTGLDLLESDINLPYVILVTSKSEYAVDAFEHNVVDYLLKPIKYSRFLKAVNRVREDDEQLEEVNDDEVFVKTDLKYVKIRFSGIKFVEAMADYVVIHIGNTKHIVHSTMKGMEKKFPSDKFVRIHRSFIVNMDMVDSIENGNAMVDNVRIPIGASYKNEFMSRLRLL